MAITSTPLKGSGRGTSSRRPSQYPPRAGTHRGGPSGTSGFRRCFRRSFRHRIAAGAERRCGDRSEGQEREHWPDPQNRAPSTPKRCLVNEVAHGPFRPFRASVPPLAPRPVSGCSASRSRRPSRASPSTASTTTARSSARPISRTARSATTTSTAPIPASGRSKATRSARSTKARRAPASSSSATARTASPSTKRSKARAAR